MAISKAFTRLDAQKKTWIGWDLNQLIQAFGQPVTRSGGPNDEWLGFKVEGCSVMLGVLTGWRELRRCSRGRRRRTLTLEAADSDMLPARASAASCRQNRDAEFPTDRHVEFPAE